MLWSSEPSGVLSLALEAACNMEEMELPAILRSSSAQPWKGTFFQSGDQQQVSVAPGQVLPSGAFCANAGDASFLLTVEFGPVPGCDWDGFLPESHSTSARWMLSLVLQLRGGQGAGTESSSPGRTCRFAETAIL